MDERTDAASVTARFVRRLTDVSLLRWELARFVLRGGPALLGVVVRQDELARTAGRAYHRPPTSGGRMKKAVIVFLAIAAFVVTMMLAGALGRWHATYAFHGGRAIPPDAIPMIILVAVVAAFAFGARYWQGRKPNG